MNFWDLNKLSKINAVLICEIDTGLFSAERVTTSWVLVGCHVDDHGDGDMAASNISKDFFLMTSTRLCLQVWFCTFTCQHVEGAVITFDMFTCTWVIL